MARPHRHAEEMPPLKCCEPARMMKASLAGAVCYWVMLLSPAPAAPGPQTGTPVVQPWRRVPLDPDYAGAWVVAGDLDGDRVPEIVSARNVDQDDVHYTSAVVAQRLDGRVLWRWGDPTTGRKKLHHDVACQIYDWDGDGRNEVVLCTRGALVELDGATGVERRRLPLPKDASDCLVFANLSGGPRATDVLVKTRYTEIWAFRRDWAPLWNVRMPGGWKTAHQLVPLDLDGDGRDEIMAGYTLLNPDGTVRWTLRPQKANLDAGHLDCCRVLRVGRTPEEWRLAMTLCGANALVVCDGRGQAVWEATGHHFESIKVGRIRGDIPGPQLAVDIDHRPWGQGVLRVFNEQGTQLTEIVTDYARHHALVEWTGDGLDDMVIAQARGVFDGQGHRLATLAMDERDLGKHDAPDVAEMQVLVGDMTGDGVPDVMLTTPFSTALYIYKNDRGRRPSQPLSPGTKANFTLY
jgi:hypothetical protein